MSARLSPWFVGRPSSVVGGGVGVAGTAVGEGVAVGWVVGAGSVVGRGVAGRCDRAALARPIVV